MGLDGVELIVNGSGSYMELRKAYVTVDHVKSATLKVGRSAVKYSKANGATY
jgi:NAD+ synthase (glutamine-hydrolysing)